MPTLVYSSKKVSLQPLSYTKDMSDYFLASKLIDSIISANKARKGVLVVKRKRFSYIPSNGNRKMVIRLHNSF